MQICEQSPQRLVLRDAPGRVWTFRIAMAFFILGGMVCLGLVLGLIGTSDRPLQEWEFFLGLVIGLGVALASLAMLARGPRCQVIFDRHLGSVAVSRSGPIFGRHIRQYDLAEIVAVEVRQTGKDGDGDPIHEAFLNLAGGGCVLLTHLGPGRERLDLLAAQVREFLSPVQGPSRL